MLRILVVDDSAVARAALTRVLGASSHVCVTAESGEEAWRQYQEGGVDLILCDWFMPGMDGLELCRHVREQPRPGGYTYFVLLTGSADQSLFLQAMAGGADDFLKKPVDLLELAVRLSVAERVLTLQRNVAEQRAALQDLTARSQAEGRQDSLTGLGNRQRLEEDLRDVMARVQRYGHAVALALCDVDLFQVYNDTYGHAAGDDVLRRLGETLRGCCRTGDRIYRYGGEEFLVLLPEQTERGARQMLGRMQRTVRQLALTHSGSPYGFITLSAGVVAVAPHTKRTLAELLSTAGEALYRAKAEGRDRVVCAEGPAPGTVPLPRPG